MDDDNIQSRILFMSNLRCTEQSPKAKLAQRVQISTIKFSIHDAFDYRSPTSNCKLQYINRCRNVTTRFSDVYLRLKIWL